MEFRPKSNLWRSHGVSRSSDPPDGGKPDGMICASWSSHRIRFGECDIHHSADNHSGFFVSWCQQRKCFREVRHRCLSNLSDGATGNDARTEAKPTGTTRAAACSGLRPRCPAAGLTVRPESGDMLSVGSGQVSGVGAGNSPQGACGLRRIDRRFTGYPGLHPLHGTRSGCGHGKMKNNSNFFFTRLTAWRKYQRIR